MKSGMTLTQFIEKQIEKYKLDDSDTMKKRLNVYFQRYLKEKNLWNNAQIVQVSKTKAKFFNIEDLEKIETDPAIQAYLIKQNGGLNQKEIIKLQNENRRESEYLTKKINGSLKREEEIEYSNRKYNESKNYEPNRFDILETMISALFYEKFELDIEEWTNDIETVENAKTAGLEDKYISTDINYILAKLALDNPVKTYVTKK